MARTFLAVLLIFFVGAADAQQAEKSSKFKNKQKTCWGNTVRPSFNAGTVRVIRGKVIDPNGESVPDALIEVYENPDLDIKKRKRVAVRRTGAGGEFDFKGLRPGKYELRASYCKSRGFDTGHTIINYAPQDKSASETEIFVKLDVSEEYTST